MPDAKTIGERIATLRKARGISQAELRRRTGANIWRFEVGRYRPRIETLEKIARELDVPMGDLLK